MIDFLRRLIQRYGFFRREPDPVSSDEWYAHRFYRGNTVTTGTPEIALTPAALKAVRLAQIARERDALKLSLAKAVKQKKKRSGIYLQIRALTNAEMAVEQGKPEPGK